MVKPQLGHDQVVVSEYRWSQEHVSLYLRTGMLSLNENMLTI